MKGQGDRCRSEDEDEEDDEEVAVPDWAAVNISAVGESWLVINGQVEVNSLKKGEKALQATWSLAWHETAWIDVEMKEGWVLPGYWFQWQG